MSLVALWVIVALGAGILEVVVPAFGFVLLALFGMGLTPQVIAFAAAALLLLVFLRPFFLRRIGGPGVPSRTDVLHGKLA